MTSQGQDQSQLRPNMIAATTSTIASTLNGIENKIENATQGLRPECFRFLHDRVFPANRFTYS